MKRKNLYNLEYKQKLIKYLSELTCFEICPKVEIISIAKLFLNDFYGHNIDMLCTLFESCGRFLFINHETHSLTKSLIDTVIRQVKHNLYEKWHLNQIENACLACNPVASLNYKNKKAKKPKDPVLAYIKFLLFSTLDKKSSSKNFQALLKFPFYNEKVFNYFYHFICFKFLYFYFLIYILFYLQFLLFNIVKFSTF